MEKETKHPFINKIWQHLVLYLCMIMSCFLAGSNLIDPFMSMAEMILCDTIAFITLIWGVCYLVSDIRKAANRAEYSARKNEYTNRMLSDYGYRTAVFACMGMLANIVVAILNSITGLMSGSAWFGSIAAYYIVLSLMRASIIRKMVKVRQIEDADVKKKIELSIYKKNSILLLLMSIVLGGLTVLLRFSQGGKVYPGFTIYAAAAYTFYRVIMSSIHLVKTRKSSSVFVSLIRKIGYVDACVSILTLQTAMISAFTRDGGKAGIETLNVWTGSVVAAMVFLIGIHGFVSAKRGKLWFL